ncbi:hypothetical protein F8568_041815 [Actinomadura sp. LD22]|uniref:DUF4190 domain-containing protein n=1 Tax=Actinomadura physcomitrii TaxID=2650748 RepID=A0A6I4MMA8_9ACTN|nr:DUF4190 domain-containing protein [Actinomadura physcomitrii]MWA06773.1 hypothetical protein [Actinomadura physcomitrii]
MSGYGGVPPGWHDPYGGYGNGGTPGWDDAGVYGPQAHPYGPPGVPYAPANNGSAIAALVCNCVLALLCCNIIAIPGIVTGALAVGRVRTDPASARRLTIWSWSLFAASVVISIILAVVYIALAVTHDSDYSSTSGV